jgi:hypothetical protein
LRKLLISKPIDFGLKILLISGGKDMNTLIVYATKYGCTEKCAVILSEKLTGKVDLCNLKGVKDVDL